MWYTRLWPNHAPGLITSVCVDGRFLTTEEAILQGKADVGVLYDVSKAIPETIECIPFVDAPITAWVREENPLAKRDTVFFEDLASFVHPLSTNMQSRTATDAVIRLFSQRGITMRSRIRNLESRADFYLTMLDDEFVISFQADTDPQRINPGLKRIVFAEPVIYHVHLAVLRDGGNPLVDQFIRICCDAAQKRNLLAD